MALLDVVFWPGRGEDGRLPSLMLSAPEMDSESEPDDSSELDGDDEKETLLRCRRFRFRRLSSSSSSLELLLLLLLLYKDPNKPRLLRSWYLRSFRPYSNGEAKRQDLHPSSRKDNKSADLRLWLRRRNPAISDESPRRPWGAAKVDGSSSVGQKNKKKKRQHFHSSMTNQLAKVALPEMKVIWAWQPGVPSRGFRSRGC